MADSPAPIIAYYNGFDSRGKWAEWLRRAANGFDVRVWPGEDVSKARYAVVWAPPPEFFRQATRAQAVLNLGAGVEHLLGISEIPAHVPIIRLSDAGMAEQMCEYALCVALRILRDMDVYEQDRSAGRWRPRAPRAKHELAIGVLGLGVLGARVADHLSSHGFAVSGWSSSRKNLTSITCEVGGTGFDAILTRSELLINLLPLTSETRGLLDRSTFEKLRPGAVVVNLARGGHLSEGDLVAALDSGRLRGAYLDVTEKEPLPAGHPFWTHPKVFLTPHVAAQTLPHLAIEQVVANIGRLERGEQPLNVIDRTRQY